MIAIKKQSEPAALLAYRKQPDSCYDGAHFTSVKDAVRSSLLEEQGYLCAYCMVSLEDDRQKVKIEHWQSQSDYPERQLDYKNMLVVCKGNEGCGIASQHCDTRKGNQKLSINPAEPSHSVEEKIKHLGNGRLTVDEPTLDDELNQVLNLNYHRLQENRKEVIRAVQQVLSKGRGTVTTVQLKKLLQAWQTTDVNGKKKSFCGTATYYLNKKLKRL